MSALHFCIICDYYISIDSVHLVCPLSDVVLRCFETVSLLPCFFFFTICDCFLARATWEPLIVDVLLQCRH